MAETSLVDLPPGAGDDFEVYVNGVRQQAGADYRQIGAALVFPRALASEGRLGFWLWLSLFLGVSGTYRRNDTVDVVFRENGRRVVASLQPRPGEETGA